MWYAQPLQRDMGDFLVDDPAETQLVARYNRLVEPYAGRARTCLAPTVSAAKPKAADVYLEVRREADSRQRLLAPTPHLRLVAQACTRDFDSHVISRPP